MFIINLNKIDELCDDLRWAGGREAGAMEPPHRNYRRLRTAPRVVRVLIGLVMILGGVFGFLPILGFWMIPLGLAVIFIDAPAVRRIWSRLRSGWNRRFRRGGGKPRG